MNNDCIFCKMAKGEMKTRVIYEDENTLGIVDTTPRFARGQCVVMHKKHVTQFYELEDSEIAELFVAVKRVAKKINDVFKPEYVCTFSRGQGVPHVHIIVFPSSPLGTMDGYFNTVQKTRRLVLEETNDDALDKTAEIIRSSGS
jgi:histidine triad (HIT) family protein